MPGTMSIWDLAISLNNKEMTSGESVNKQKEASLLFVGNNVNNVNKTLG